MVCGLLLAVCCLLAVWCVLSVAYVHDVSQLFVFVFAVCCRCVLLVVCWLFVVCCVLRAVRCLLCCMSFKMCLCVGLLFV